MADRPEMNQGRRGSTVLYAVFLAALLAVLGMGYMTAGVYSRQELTGMMRYGQAQAAGKLWRITPGRRIPERKRKTEGMRMNGRNFCGERWKAGNTYPAAKERWMACVRKSFCARFPMTGRHMYTHV